MTRRQNELLRYVIVELDTAAVSPSYDEMQKAMLLASKSGVARLVNGLIDRGYLCREGGGARSLSVTPAGYSAIAGTLLEHFTNEDLVAELRRRGLQRVSDQVRTSIDALADRPVRP